MHLSGLMWSVEKRGAIKSCEIYSHLVAHTGGVMVVTHMIIMLSVGLNDILAQPLCMTHSTLEFVCARTNGRAG